jgi:hypothetical protein
VIRTLELDSLGRPRPPNRDQAEIRRWTTSCSARWRNRARGTRGERHLAGQHRQGEALYPGGLGRDPVASAFDEAGPDADHRAIGAVADRGGDGVVASEETSSALLCLAVPGRRERSPAPVGAPKPWSIAVTPSSSSKPFSMSLTSSVIVRSGRSAGPPGSLGMLGSRSGGPKSAPLPSPPSPPEPSLPSPDPGVRTSRGGTLAHRPRHVGTQKPARAYQPHSRPFRSLAQPGNRQRMAAA